jgi:hypothetical protein
MPVAVALVKPLRPLPTSMAPPFRAGLGGVCFRPGCQTSRSAACDIFQILVVHLRHFSGYVGGKISVRVCAFP